MFGVIFFALAIWAGLWAVYYLRTHGIMKRKLLAKLERVFHAPVHPDTRLSKVFQRVDESKWGQRLRGKLETSYMRITPSEYIVFSGAAFAIVFWVLRLLFHLDGRIDLLLTSGLLYAGKGQIFRAQKNRTKVLFQQQLPEACRLLGNSLRAGFTLSQGIEMLSTELPSPAKHEFQAVYKDLRLGMELEKTLESLQQRIQTKEIGLFVGSLIMQHQMGGNLTVLLDDMARTIEERTLLQQSVRTLTAEARYIAALLPLLPIVLMAMMSSFVDRFLEPLLTAPGLLLIGGFLIVQMVSILFIRKLIRIQV